MPGVPPVIPVLISGGRGTRLWPLSRTALPKQLHPLVTDRTLIQDTVTRMVGLPDVTGPMVVCNARHIDEIRHQLAAVGVPPTVLVGEPVGRHTAAAIAAAALVAPDDAVIAVLPADAAITDVGAFRTAMGVAIEAARAGSVVTFGVVPDRPETGYGWIRASGEGGARTIEEFVEKPDEERALSMLDGRHFWNSGMFVMRSDVVLDELRRFVPALVETVASAVVDPVGGVVELGASFSDAESVAFDIAVMERTDRAVMVPLDAGWDDVGSWRALWERAAQDERGNATTGDVVLDDVSGSYVRASGRTVVVSGLEEVLVVDAGDVVYVGSMDAAADVRRLVADLDRERPDLT